MNQLPLDLQPTEQVYRIPLTQRQFAIVDEEDFNRLSQFKWQACWMKNSHSYYAMRHTPTRGGAKRRTILMSREIMGFPEGRMVDHRNHNTLDNRRENLRVATAEQNNRNAKIRIDNSSGFKGVNYHKINRRWTATVRVNGIQTYLGSFVTKEEAVEVRRSVSEKLYGQFVNHGHLPSPEETSR